MRCTYYIDVTYTWFLPGSILWFIYKASTVRSDKVTLLLSVQLTCEVLTIFISI